MVHHFKTAIRRDMMTERNPFKTFTRSSDGFLNASL